jgi:hypothetical protein
MERKFPWTPVVLIAAVLKKQGRTPSDQAEKSTYYDFSKSLHHTLFTKFYIAAAG